MWTWAEPTVPPGNSHSGPWSTLRSSPNGLALTRGSGPGESGAGALPPDPHPDPCVGTDGDPSDGGPRASDPDRADRRLSAVAPVRVREGILVAGSYRIRPSPSARPGANAYMTVLRTAEARLPAAHLAPGHRVRIQAAGGDQADGPTRAYGLAPPDDLLAVLGWSWRPLKAIKNGWRGTLKLARREPKRTADAEAKLTRTVSSSGAHPGGAAERLRTRACTAHGG